MATVKINTAYNVQIDFELAGLDKRFFAWLIDFVIRLFYWLLIDGFARSLFYENFMDEDAMQKYYIARIIGLIPILFYYAIFEVFFNGQTIGKRLMKIRVASIDGYTPTVTQYLTRWVFRLIDLGFISIFFIYGSALYEGWLSLVFIVPNIVAIIMVLNSKKEQRLGDVASGTVVIRLNPSTQISDTIFEHVAADYVVRYPNVLRLSDRDVTIIKTALQNARKTGYDTTLWHITEKLKTVLSLDQVDEPYYFLETVIRDYNYLSSH
jgi:uncharacterized RDD family membrane protein YckC